jgi:uncharacterized protein YyaL (SSP411 family)
MERESYMDEKIAALLNRYFISIKIDREELPHIDSYYQQIYKRHYGSFGGWPLNIFMTANKEPFYITNYIPKKSYKGVEGFSDLIIRMHKIYKNKPLLKKSIENLLHTQKPNKKVKKEPAIKDLTQKILQDYDEEYVGFGKNNRFAEASKINLMLDLSYFSKSQRLKKNYFDMLDIMALRGLYDHVNGGFFRYAVDREWEIPHFEKMLYTQAELIPLYVKGYHLVKKRLYKDVIKESIAMVERRFCIGNLYLSASDAESQGKEGGYFTFTKEEIAKALQNNPHAREIQEAMEFSFEGNFHNRVHINFFTNSRPKGFAAFSKALKQIAAKRVYPFIDTKINTAWNAMMIEALYIASSIDKKYAKLASKHLNALRELMFDRGELYHQTLYGIKPTQKALLEDYAYFIAALIAAYEVDYNKEHLEFASYLLSKAKEEFYKDGIWYLNSDTPRVEADLNDKYYTSALAKMLQNIIKLSALQSSFEYEVLVKKSLNHLDNQLYTKMSDVPGLARAYLMQHYCLYILKSSRLNLQRDKEAIAQLRYPYIVTKAAPFDDYLLCKLRRCFAKEKYLFKIEDMLKTLE